MWLPIEHFDPQYHYRIELIMYWEILDTPHVVVVPVRLRMRLLAIIDWVSDKIQIIPPHQSLCFGVATLPRLVVVPGSFVVATIYGNRSITYPNFLLLLLLPPPHCRNDILGDGAVVVVLVVHSAVVVVVVCVVVVVVVVFVVVVLVVVAKE